MGNHGPELHAENAVGTANHRLGHGNSWVRRREQRPAFREEPYHRCPHRLL